LSNPGAETGKPVRDKGISPKEGVSPIGVATWPYHGRENAAKVAFLRLG